jgi:hypothetical protein
VPIRSGTPDHAILSLVAPIQTDRANPVSAGTQSFSGRPVKKVVEMFDEAAANTKFRQTSGEVSADVIHIAVIRVDNGESRVGQDGWFSNTAFDLKYDMTSIRTVKTLAYLMAAMTAVTMLLSLLEPWTVSLRPHEAHAGQEMLPPTLSAVRQTSWQSLELVLVAQEPGQTARLPRTHLIVHPDGHVETTALYASAQPLPNQVLRVCAVYQGQPSDDRMQGWLAVCDDARGHFRTTTQGIRLKTMPQAHASPSQVEILGNIQRRLSAILKGR